MPQAYSVATGPAAARTRSPEAVSYSRGAGPLPGSTGTSTRRQESMSVRLSCGDLCLARPVGPATGPGCGRAAHGLSQAGGQARDLADVGGLLEGVGQGDQPWFGPARPEERDADRQPGH